MERTYLSPPDVGTEERTALARALESGWIAPIGPELDAFEYEIAAITGTAAAVGLTSGTAALHLALATAGVTGGDDVLVSSLTFSASANAVVYTGAKPVFIDSENASWNMCPELLADELARRARANHLPKAVMVVDLYGQCADYGAIEPLCAQYGVTLIEDSAEALGASCLGRPAGSFGDAGVISFNGNKIITTSGGGMLVTNDVERAQKVRYLATQARQPVPHYEHTELGYNYRLSNLLAAMGRAQLHRLPAFVARRRAINELYRELLGDIDGVEFMPIAPWGEWNGWLTCLTFPKAAHPGEAMAALAEYNIESRPLWKPMHRQPFYRDCEARNNGVSDRLFERGICLPSGSSLTDETVAWIAGIVRKAVTGQRLPAHV